MDLDKHTDQGAAAVALAAKLLENRIQIETGCFPLMEQTDRRRTLGRVKRHLGHDRLGHADLLGADPPIGLGNATHHRKGGGEESGLDTLTVAGLEPHVIRQGFQAFVEVMPQCRAQQGPERPAQHEAKGPSNEFSPPAQIDSSIMPLD